MMTLPIRFETEVCLAPLTTLDLGGNAERMYRVKDEKDVRLLMEWLLAQAPEERPDLLPLGGGSNMLISDRGFSGVVIKMETTVLEILKETEQEVLVRVGAGKVWDDFVREMAELGHAGVECLAGVPGCVGAAPFQNIGAYGQEVSETIVSVDGFLLATGEAFSFNNEQCEFGYRDSKFKKSPRGTYLITSVTFRLRPGGEPTVRYSDLRRRCEEGSVGSLSELRDLVLEIRKSKSMVYDTKDPNHRSAGSFFTNPIVSLRTADELQAKLGEETKAPRYPASEGKVKLSAAWLIENSGLPKGFKLSEDSPVGLSTKHVLALTNRGGATSSQLLELCRYVQSRVKQRFGIELEPEPEFIGEFTA